MCGISGKINFKTKKPVTVADIKPAVTAMTHRGPDDEGIFTDGYAGIGMRRLDIIDIKGGHQPIFNENGNMAIVFNGEIYNFVGLRDELIAKGHRFSTRSDTEVILHLYEEYGPECLGRLNGMFAFAIWDKTRKRLFIARDRFGIKPLFYAITDDGIVFSSEIKSLLTNPSVPREADNDALIDYLSFYYVSSPRTMFRHIKRLQPAHYIFVDGNGIEIKKYWQYAASPQKLSSEEWVKRINEALLQSVKRHLQSEVPLGVFLSSGLDSTSIVAMMQKLSFETRTYTIGYENGRTFNELEESKLVARKYGTIHHDCMLKPRELETYIPEITRHLAEPHGDWTQAALYFLSKNSRNDVTVVLTGMGSDELFAGYPTLTAAKIASFYRKLPAAARKMIKYAVNKLPVSYDRLSFDFKAKSFVAGADMAPEAAHMRYKEIFSDAERAKLLYNKAGGHNPFDVYGQYLAQVSDHGLLDRLMYLDMNVFLPDCALQLADITTMMNSQECRVPFLDMEMVELASQIPMDLKLKGFTTKYILRKALKEYLPEEILRMPKKGLAMPTPYWLRDELRDFVNGVFSDAEKRNPDAFDFKYVRELYTQHINGARDNTRKLTCLVSLFLWQGYYQ
jgi:asparagine synthase (glutamine-hydrolysing)